MILFIYYVVYSLCHSSSLYVHTDRMCLTVQFRKSRPVHSECIYKQSCCHLLKWSKITIYCQMNTAFMPRSSYSLCCKHIFCVKVQIAREHTPCALAVTFLVFRCFVVVAICLLFLCVSVVIDGYCIHVNYLTRSPWRDTSSWCAFRAQRPFRVQLTSIMKPSQ